MRNILILVICTLLSAGVLCAATTPVPANLMAQPAIASDGASSMTSCIVGEFCGVGADLLAPGEGAPIPWCAPGYRCNPPVVTAARAGEGAPIPWCAPGYPCNPPVVTSARAGEGAPIPWCAPGYPCNPPVVTAARAGEGAPINLDQERLLMAL
jgi:hypothetical protein